MDRAARHERTGPRGTTLRPDLAAASVLAHVAAALGLAAVPSPPRAAVLASPPAYPTITWLEILPSPETPELPAIAEPDPAARPADPPPTPARPDRARARVASHRSSSADSTTAPTAGAGVGLPLLGLRKPADGGPAPLPRIAPGTAFDDGPGPARDLGPAGVDPPPDRRPRSLAERGFVPRRDGSFVYRDKKLPLIAKIHPDGRMEFTDLPAKVVVTPFGIGFKHLGLSEAARAAAGEELFRGFKKQLLEETFDLRMSLAIASAERHIDRQLQRIYRDLLEGWRDRSRSARARRALLFERWDEADDGFVVDVGEFERRAAARLAEARAAAARRARRTVIEFIHTHLPAGSEHAYPVEELAELNTRRRSAEPFDPYAAPR